MFTRTSSNAQLDKEITAALAELRTLRDEPDKYAVVVERISKLQKLKSESGLRPPSMDTVLIVGANIFGVLWLTRFEKERVIPSKSALSFVMRPK